MSHLIGPRFSAWLQSRPHYTIANPDATGAIVGYLTRYRLLRWCGITLFLHNGHRSDGDRELHSHPWAWCGLIVKGGYKEHRLSGVYRRRPGQLIIMGRSKLHRIEVCPGHDWWSLVLTVPRGHHSWFFLAGKRLVPWITFLRAKGIPLGHI